MAAIRTSRGTEKRSKTMKRVIAILTSCLFVVFVLSVQTAKAQEDVARLLEQLEEHTDQFSKTLDEGLDHTDINGTNTEDEINNYVKQFEEATDRLKKNYDKGHDNRVAVREVLGRAKTIDSFLKKHEINETVTTEWTNVKTDLARLAKEHKVKLDF
jgi:uncharacterized protein YktB (UPF0637 family)